MAVIAPSLTLFCLARAFVEQGNLNLKMKGKIENSNNDEKMRKKKHMLRILLIIYD